MKPYYTDDAVTLWHGKCEDILPTLPDCSVDAVVTDPPYELGFMGKGWDSTGIAYSVDMWAECLRVLKPGGHLLAFGGTRTWHRLACAVEDAGFELRDSIAWLYGSGFPKSLDVSKAIDKRPGVMRHAEFARHLAEKREAAGLARADVSEAVVGTRTGACWNWEHHQFPEAKWWPALRDLLDLDDDTWGPVIAEAERAKVGAAYRLDRKQGAVNYGGGTPEGHYDLTANATDAAQQWAGWGTALKPAFEPVVVARKPLAGTVAANVLAWGTGALNIDATRISTDEDRRRNARGGDNGLNGEGTFRIRERRADDQPLTAGRWPANVVLDEHAAAELDRQSGTLASGANPTRRGSDKFREAYGDFKGQAECTPARGADTGGASRFFYVAKAPTSERPRYNKSVLRLRAGLTPEQVGHVRARLAEAGVRID